MAKTYSVVYYIGGTELGSWHWTTPVFADLPMAYEYAKTINKQGYYTLIHETAKLKAIGLPEGAPIDLLKWQHDNLCMKQYCNCKV